jgi:sulfur carrier protein ThiS adenylyltransferase
MIRWKLSASWEGDEAVRIRLNGGEIETGSMTVYGLKPDLSPERTAVIVNGFQLDGDQALAEGDDIYIIDKTVLPSPEHLEAMMAARHTPHVHAALKKGRVAVAGLGGLGSNIAVSLARIGVGHQLLVDFDTVEPSNLNRQSYYIRHLGQLKTEALEEQLREINPFIELATAAMRVQADNVAALFRNCDIICEAFDQPGEKAMLVNAVLEQLPAVRIVAASGMAGYASANLICTERVLERLYICGDRENEARAGNGLMAPRVQICAGHQANMVMRLLLGADTV